MSQKHPLIYVQESLGDNEDLVDAAFYHWMFLCTALIWMVILAGLAVFTMMVGSVYYYYPNLQPIRLFEAMELLELHHYFDTFWHSHVFFRGFAFALLMIGLLHFGGVLIIRATTEIAVTDRRLIFKRGLISRNVEEMRVENIESVDVKQTILGRIFHYGGIHVLGTGSGGIEFPRMLANPISFRKAIQHAREIKLEE